jgi:sortase A
MEPSMRKRGLLTWLGSALIVGGAAVLACYWWTVHEAATARQRAHEWLSRTTVEPRPAARALRRGDVIGELEIPRLHVSVAVFEGDDAGILRLGAGHIPDTALLPGSGNIGIAAHRDTYFRPLRVIQVNDVITLKTAVGVSRYAVTETKIVRSSNIGVLARASGRDLTLVTCYPFYYIGRAPERFIVHARKVG